MLWPYVYDLIFILLIVLMVRRGWRTGFLASLLRLAGWVVAVLLIVSCSEKMATWVFENLLHDKIVDLVTAAIPPDVLAAANEGAATLSSIQSILDGLGGILGNVSINTEAMQTIVDIMRTDGKTLAQAITDNILRPVVIPAVQVAVSVLLFLVCVTVFKALARMTARHHRRRGRGGLNGTLGAVVGFLEGFAAAYIYSFVLSLLADFGGEHLNFINPAIFNSTILVHLLVK